MRQETLGSLDLSVINLYEYFIYIKGFPRSSVGKASACNAGDLGAIPGSGISPGEGNGNPLQYSFQENSMDRGAWKATVYEVVKSLPAVWEMQVRSLGREYPLEKEMATHSSILAWKIPRMEESSRLQSTESQRVRYDLASPLQYSCLENPMNRGAWWASGHGIAKNQTQLATEQEQEQM